MGKPLSILLDRIEQEESMTEALRAARANEELAAKLELYGQFVGSWVLDVNFHHRDGSVRRTAGELHFSWVLDGKAIQDVWIYPARRLRGDRPAEGWHACGSTFRWYDPAIDAWHIALVRSQPAYRNPPDRPGGGRRNRADRRRPQRFAEPLEVRRDHGTVFHPAR